MRATGWLGLGLIGCAGEPNVRVDRWAIRSCEIREAPSAERFGLWSGELAFRQEVGGQLDDGVLMGSLPTHSAASAAETTPSGLAPLHALPSMGFFGDWGAYASGGPGVNLLPLWERGGNVDAFAYYGREADGPANSLAISGGEICETESSFEWRATVAYSWADLFDYNTYDYTDASAPKATLQVHELLQIVDDQLVVISISEGELDDGRTLTMRSEGVLLR